MRHVSTIMLVALCTSTAQADEATLKPFAEQQARLEEAQRLKRLPAAHSLRSVGIGLTGGGIMMLTLGGIVMLATSDDRCYQGECWGQGIGRVVGGSVSGLGLLLAIAGAPLWIVGQMRINEAQKSSVQVTSLGLAPLKLGDRYDGMVATVRFSF